MPGVSIESLSEVCRLLEQRAGFLLDSLGEQGIVHAVHRRMAVSGTDALPAYAHRLLLDTAEFQELLEELVVPETWFFRDPLAFSCLASHLDAWRSSVGILRVLSVACSTGEEVYSLAMALREAGLEPSQFRVVGADVSRRSLKLARDGRFSARSFRNISASVGALRERWCEPVGEAWRVGDALRAGVEFMWGNLADGSFLAGESPFDVVFCRNVLIYFHAEARGTAVGHLRRLLKRDGLMCSAPAEARVFSEAGFSSLGSECPFAFRHQDVRAEVAATEKSAAGPRVDALSRSSAPARARVPTRLIARSSLDDADRKLTPVATTNSPVAQRSEQTALEAAKQAADGGRLEEAGELCDRVLARDPASAEAHHLKGVIQRAQGMLREAQRSFEKALYLDPRHYQALLHLMLLAQERGDQPAAENYQRRARQVAPEEAK